ncbi:MAG: metal ABC transporter permease [Deltaproteobacteria bacterium]|nr:metal ABC transporter permease [Deltaproteobacteria bacterium]
MEILFSAFLLSLVLVGIHAYFGLEIIRRGIIFTDLAVGQGAALGAAASLFFWDGRFQYGCSLLAALLFALWISLASNRGRFPEAFIGLVYALGISAVFLLLSKSPHGTEEFQRLLVSDLLYVSLDQVAHTAGLYALIGLALWGLTRLPEGRLRHIGFFLLFALTVTSSVKLAGVLVVFALLVGPALVAVTLCNRRQLWLAWIYGIIVNSCGTLVSYHVDLPTGQTLVFCQAFLGTLIYFLGCRRMDRSKKGPFSR